MTRRFLALAALVTFAGCTLDKQGVPQLAGPSELGLSLAIKVSPDIITQDGQSRATIEIRAFDPNGQPPRPEVTMRVETAVNGTIVDVGTLSARTVSTSNGVATLTYVSPPPPPPTVGSDTVVDFVVTPIDGNYQNSSARTASLRLARPGVIQPPNGSPKAAFFFSPTAPKAGDDVFFDGSASTDDGQIVSYTWNFGDGSTGGGKQSVHSFDLPGEYSVTLTVTDDRGQSTTSAPQSVAVGANTAPVANFTYSPQAPKVNTSVFFNGSSSTAALGRQIVAWDWNFGDGSSDDHGRNVAHTFTKTGTYTVTLIVTDSAGQTAVISTVITINP
jgi:PKD repeat protein